MVLLDKAYKKFDNDPIIHTFCTNTFVQNTNLRNIPNKIKSTLQSFLNKTIQSAQNAQTKQPL